MASRCSTFVSSWRFSLASGVGLGASRSLAEMGGGARAGAIRVARSIIPLLIGAAARAALRAALRLSSSPVSAPVLGPRAAPELRVTSII
eukprot:CAMPEP_0177579944 /NCGR_PEP_ID=MMETSP0419_2-20121207/1257_1 /TAXON_ID=582737 /ORGANISM="Tetraselmis sp., Strain GSL018" /LENGTH=89 /DNA_ID=CAMNT_0019068699 /DNA_START=860 /DNA_END=1129 /DNA_ORIENTATION=+